MTTETRQEGSVTVLTPKGAITEEELSSLSADVDALDPQCRVVISLAEVPYLDSAALEYLLTLNDAFAMSHRRIKFSETQPVTREIFRLTDLEDEFDFYDSVEDAVRSFL